MSDILDVHHTRLEAIVARDVATLKELVHEDLIYTSARGKVMRRPEAFAGFESGTLRVTHMDSSEIEAKVYGDCAIVTYVVESTTYDHGEELSGRFRASTTYIRDQGRWRLLLAQQTRIEGS